MATQRKQAEDQPDKADEAITVAPADEEKAASDEPAGSAANVGPEDLPREESDTGLPNAYVVDALDPPQPEPGTGPDGVEVPNRGDKAEVLATVTQPEITSVNPKPYNEAELNHRFSHIPPEGFEERKFPTIQF